MPHVIVYSNHDLANPYQLVELYDNVRKIDCDRVA